MSTAKKGKAKGNKAKGKAKSAKSTAAQWKTRGPDVTGIIRPSDGIPPFHPLANVDELIEGADYAALVEDIRVHGLRDHVVMYQDMILDGRNRARACAEAGVDLLFATLGFASDADAAAYLDSANLHRRHLTPEQKNDRITARLKANPTVSDRQIAKQTGATRPRVAKVRRKLEKSGDVARSYHVSDTKGREQPRHRKVTKSARPKPTGAKPTVDKSEPARAEPETSATSEAPPRDVGAYSAGEHDRLRARIDELNTEVRRLELKVSGLEAENNEQRLEIGQLKSVAVELGTSTSTIINAADIGGALAILVNFGRFDIRDFIVADVEALNPVDLMELAKNIEDIADDIKREKKKAKKTAKTVEPAGKPETVKPVPQTTNVKTIIKVPKSEPQPWTGKLQWVYDHAQTPWGMLRITISDDGKIYGAVFDHGEVIGKIDASDYNDRNYAEVELKALAQTWCDDYAKIPDDLSVPEFLDRTKQGAAVS